MGTFVAIVLVQTERGWATVRLLAVVLAGLAFALTFLVRYALAFALSLDPLAPVALLLLLLALLAGVALLEAC